MPLSYVVLGDDGTWISIYFTHCGEVMVMVHENDLDEFLGNECWRNAVCIRFAKILSWAYGRLPASEIVKTGRVPKGWRSGDEVPKSILKY